MSTQSNFSILRKDTRIKLTDEDEKYIAEQLQSFKDEHERRKESYEKYKGSMEGWREPKLYIPEFVYLDEYHWYNTKTKEVWVNVYDEYFTSSFRQLYEYFGCGYDGERSQYFLTKEDAQEILTAAKYLLNGNYDRKIEAMLDTRFIDVLSDLSYNYLTRGRKAKRGLCLFLEKTDGGGYTLTDREYENSDEDFEEPDDSYILENLIYIMQLFLKELEESVDYDKKQKTEVRLMYRLT